MNIITLGKEAQHVCLRYRIEPVREALRALGHWFSIQQMPRTPWGRLALYRDLRHAHVVVVQRRLLSPWELPLLRRNARHLIFDFDDAFFQKNSHHAQTSDPKRLVRFKAMVQAADQIFAGNSYLAECASQFTVSSKFVEMPTCVDTSLYPIARHVRRGPGVRLAWIGSSSTLRTLELQAEMWNKLGQALPGLELHVICDRFPKWTGIKIVPVPWSVAIETSHLAQCDIGLAYLPSDTWSQGKCGLKVLQYQAAGLPVVTSPVGVHRQMVTPDVNGFHASTLSEWIVHVGRLMANPVLRQQMGQRGRQQVEESFSTATLVHRWKHALQLDTNLASLAA
jgi:glycosyltransferase involved in cell wall biosynthesis